MGYPCTNQRNAKKVKNELDLNSHAHPVMKKEKTKYVDCAHCGVRVRLDEAVDYKHRLLYGEHKTEFVLKMERAQAPPELELEVGKRLQIRLNDGTTRVVTVVAITEDSVILDANDPLAGKTLKFEIELVEVRPE